MNIVFLAHPEFLGHQSMPRYTRMLKEGMIQRGHTVEVWRPRPVFYRVPLKHGIRKWLGYIDQYIIFTSDLKKRIKSCPEDTLFVLTDQALGPWLPFILNRRHIIHCHDFLALQSALGLIPESKLKWTGKKYQMYILKGFSRGKHFISVSKKTESTLRKFLPSVPESSEVVYNALNALFKPCDTADARALLGKKTGADVSRGYLLHVGGNQWYKNRTGVIGIYDAWRSTSRHRLPLILMGDSPSRELLEIYEASPYKSDIHFLSGMPDNLIRIAYSGASVFLFPSLAEGFGWPIAEAMACGCPVITTAETPMTEVAGDAAFLISKRPVLNEMVRQWEREGAKAIDKILALPASEKKLLYEAGIRNAKRFDADLIIDQIEDIYMKVVYGKENFVLHAEKDKVF